MSSIPNFRQKLQPPEGYLVAYRKFHTGSMPSLLWRLYICEKTEAKIPNIQISPKLCFNNLIKLSRK